MDGRGVEEYRASYKKESKTAVCEKVGRQTDLAGLLNIL